MTNRGGGLLCMAAMGMRQTAGAADSCRARGGGNASLPGSVGFRGGSRCIARNGWYARKDEGAGGRREGAQRGRRRIRSRRAAHPQPNRGETPIARRTATVSVIASVTVGLKTMDVRPFSSMSGAVEGLGEL